MLRIGSKWSFRVLEFVDTWRQLSFMGGEYRRTVYPLRSRVSLEILCEWPCSRATEETSL